ncbi:hypothetical protein [Streptomyces sp. NPDC014676]|uniref:hypothetical protein n=1 Tax=Streptomyces sp. NPDC014676 TaxID=3364879 RepID=UPI0036FF1AF4
MKHITGRAVRAVIGGMVVATALAVLSLALGASPAEAADGVPTPQTGQAAPAPSGAGPEDLGEPVFSKPQEPGGEKGSWVWDDLHP